jgi:hypothetical protein
MKIFGREPAVWVGFIEAAIALAMAAGWIDITADQTAQIMAVVVAVFGVLTAYLTHDTMLGVLVGLTKATLALIVGFGFTLSPELTASIIAFVVVVVGLFQRTQTTPEAGWTTETA